MSISKRIRLVTLATLVSFSMGGHALANSCDPQVSQVLDKQRTTYIDSMSDLANKNFSQRPGTFAATTCLDNLMKGGGMDIFFKPPSLDGILDMVKNLACEQASQIFNNAMGGSGINGGSVLNSGELLKGINMGGGSGAFSVNLGSSGGGSISAPRIGDLFK